MPTVTDAIHCLRMQVSDGTYRGAKIGRLRADVGTKQTGDIVVFTPDADDPRACVVEVPMTCQEIWKERDRGSLATTFTPCADIAIQLVEELQAETQRALEPYDLGGKHENATPP